MRTRRGECPGRRAWYRTVVLAVAAAMLAGPATSAPLPESIGACSETAVLRVGPRLAGDPRSGSGILYENGGTQVSYEVLPPLMRSRKGDRIRLCLVSIPSGCPAGDNRGRVYRATNLRTNGTWTAADSQHSCGGA